jgi:predicted PurR-regulated permease PerM
MRNLIFNSNTLQFQESGIEKKITKLYGTIIPLVIFIFVIFYSNSIVNSQLNDTINRLNSTIKEKNKQIKSLQTPYSNVDSVFLSQLKENIGSIDIILGSDVLTEIDKVHMEISNPAP